MLPIRERRTSIDRRKNDETVAAELATAFARGQIEVLYQPQFSCDDDRLVGAEALARWNHPLRGQIGAEAMFALAGRAGMSERLTRHVATCALGDAADWAPHLTLSLNVTAADIAAPDFAEALTTIVDKLSFSPGRLTLELTEHALVRDIEGSVCQLNRLAAEGMRLALDDFGAGFCNFGYLKVLPLHYLKLDRSMVEGIVSGPRDLAILRAIVAMAGALDIAVIAEGIERTAQLAAVRAEGCAFYQGFLRARPMDAQTFAAFARDQETGTAAIG
ncbi:EAL domain-containing protein [Pelagerythrobacter marensis]|uniref:Diguanylate cyclase/phosphodiesterase n=1 Tax=Pelagerythrobacter marensis TaxID=543877 RepID=A0A0G3X7I1_9SPHN|nr:EAL domain-containing protein [Pelagerythrobacter marensis]AKM07142.1 Diguanylate cyclase/phosphodiesterase [Pelagerythrobacter marensis]